MWNDWAIHDDNKNIKNLKNLNSNNNVGRSYENKISINFIITIVAAVAVTAISICLYVLCIFSYQSQWDENQEYSVCVMENVNRTASIGFWNEI